MTTPIIGHISLYHMFMYFFIYSFLGWVVEVIYATLKTGKFVNRGFLNGPVCPIYGTGMAICVLLLNPFAESWWLLFLAGGAFATLLELFTGFLLDKIFKTKWWDYSKEHFNIKGYVCLKFSLIWAIAILLMFHTLVPLTDTIINAIPFMPWGLTIICVFSAVLIADVISDLVQLKRLKNNIKEFNVIAKIIHANSDKIGEKVSDATVAVNKRVKELREKLQSSRLGKAFPQLKKKHDDAISEMEKSGAAELVATDTRNMTTETEPNESTVTGAKTETTESPVTETKTETTENKDDN